LNRTIAIISPAMVDNLKKWSALEKKIVFVFLIKTYPTKSYISGFNLYC